MASRTDYNKKYYQLHREQRREYFRIIDQERSNTKVKAFWAALCEIEDQDVFEHVVAMIEATKRLLIERGNLKEYAAESQSIEFVATLILKGVNVPRKTVAAALGRR